MSVVLVTTYLSISYLSAVGMDVGIHANDVSPSPMAHQLNLSSTKGILTTEASVSAEQTLTRPVGQWLNSYEKAQQIAIRHKLPLLLHFDAPWCGACRQMEANVLLTSSVKAKLGTEVIGVRLNADVNKHLIAQFGISTLPTEVVIFGDGTRGETFVGATSLSSYVSRLTSISGKNSAVFQDTQTAVTASANGTTNSDTSSTNMNLRSCLIVTRNGAMVGLGGFSPVSLHNNRAWKKGDQKYVVSHDGVDYYLTSPEQVSEFESNPTTFIPKFHGCDLVTLRHKNEVKTGAIEFGAFYDGNMYFFATTSNRDRFQKNPAWYLEGASLAKLLTPAMLAEEGSVNN